MEQAGIIRRLGDENNAVSIKDYLQINNSADKLFNILKITGADTFILKLTDEVYVKS